MRPAGMVFYDAKGGEVGGLAITDARMGLISALSFDDPSHDALGLVARVSPDGKEAEAGLQVNSRPPPELDLVGAAKVVQRRIAVHNESENAEILLADPQGRDRIRLRVDAKGEARIEVLDAEGRVTFRAPEEGKR